MKNKYRLDFEQPLVELEEKLAKLIQFSKDNKVDMSSEIQKMEKTFLKEKKKLFENLSAWERVQLARHPSRPYSLDYIKMLFTDFFELKGDRRFGDDPALIGGFAKINDQQIMLLAHQKGRNLEERNLRNFGMAHPEGYRKALRLMKLAEKANTPIITFIDTPGAYPGLGSEERHVGEAIAVNLRDMFKLKVPIISVVIGEGGSGGALGIGVGNTVLILENAYYSVISPEGCAGIIWKDGAVAPKAAESLKLTSKDLLKSGVVDGVISEPLGGAHENPEKAGEFLKEALLENLSILQKMTKKEITEHRYNKFRNIGVTA